MSFAAKIETEKNDNIFLVTGGKDNKGIDAWYYVRVDSVRTNKFLKSVETGRVNFDDFGIILESGYGETPPESIKLHMQQEYNFEV